MQIATLSTMLQEMYLKLLETNDVNSTMSI